MDCICGITQEAKAELIIRSYSRSQKAHGLGISIDFWSRILISEACSFQVSYKSLADFHFLGSFFKTDQSDCVQIRD
jgi:hypothetical protein